MSIWADQRIKELLAFKADAEKRIAELEAKVSTLEAPMLKSREPMGLPKR